MDNKAKNQNLMVDMLITFNVILQLKLLHLHLKLTFLVHDGVPLVTGILADLLIYYGIYCCYWQLH